MAGGLYVQIDQSAIKDMCTSPNGMVGRDIYRRGQNVLAAAKKGAPVLTGRLRSSLGIQVGKSRGEVVARIGTNVNYARYVHDGTGIFGPKSTPITPKRQGGVLKFEAGGKTVYARSVKGMRGRPFMLDALRRAVD